MRSLIKQGASEFIKSSSKGSCRSSKTKGINIAISNAFLARQGLMTLKTCGLKFTIHHKMNRPVRSGMQRGVGAGD